MKTERQVNTIAGYFGHNRIEQLRKTLDEAEGDVVMFEGQQLDTRFGAYLLAFVDGEYARLNNGGL